MKILAIQSRMGIGDTIIFLPFIKALSKKFNSPINILVKENSKANQYLHQTKYIDKILTPVSYTHLTLPTKRIV